MPRGSKVQIREVQHKALVVTCSAIEPKIERVFPLRPTLIYIETAKTTEKRLPRIRESTTHPRV